MYINVIRGVIQALIQVAMLNRVAATATKVATTTVLAAWHTDAFCRRQQIHTIRRQAGFTLYVNAGLVMADQAVNIRLIFKIKIFIIPTVTRMAGRAGCPVALDTDAEVIDGFLLTGGIKPFPAFNLHRL